MSGVEGAVASAAAPTDAEPRTVHIFTRTPPHQALIGTTPAKWSHEQAECVNEVDLDRLIESLTVPLGGVAYICREVARVSSTIVKEVER